MTFAGTRIRRPVKALLAAGLLFSLVPSVSQAAQQIPITAAPGAVLGTLGGVKSYILPTTVVPLGSNVLFRNLDVTTHNMNSDTGLWSSALIGTGAHEVVYVFRLPAGTYGFHCTAHPWMKGKIIIKKL